MFKTLWIWIFPTWFYVLIFSTVTFGEVGGIDKTDSLRNVIEISNGTEKISTQLELASQILETNKTEACSLANSALLFARNMGDKNMEMRSMNLLGSIYTAMGNYQISLAYLDTALTITGQINDNWYKGEILYRRGVNKHRMGESLQALESFNASIQAGRLSHNFKILGSSYSIMGTIFRMNGMYDRAIEYIIKSKLNYEKAEFIEGDAWASYLLGRIYADLKLPEKALEYFQGALDVYQKLASIDGNESGTAICYEQIGIINLEMGNLEEARKNIDKTLKIYTDLESEYGISNVYKNLGKIEYFAKNYPKSEDYLSEALLIKKRVGDQLSLPGIHEYIGLSQIERGQVKEGLKNIETGLNLAISNNQKRIQLDIYSKLTETYLILNEREKAIQCQKKQIEIQNLILSGDADIKMEQLQTIFEIDEKNNQIAELEKQNEINTLTIQKQRILRNIMILGILLALFFSATIFWFYNKIRLKNHQLFETNAAKDKLFAIIAHDLRGPTGALASLLEHIHTSFDEFSISELRKMMKVLYKSAENVSNLLENLLIWSQSQVDKIKSRPVEIQLNSVIQNSIKGINQFAENKQIKIEVKSDDRIVVFADPDMVQTIVRNILSNAIKFSNREGLVVIETEIKDYQTAIVRIVDNGVGIEKSNLSKIFDLTFKHHTNGTENEKSTGLGLILVKDFVEKNNGVLTIESEKGKGTSVAFTLPLIQGGSI